MPKPGKLVAAGPLPHAAMGTRIRIVTYDHRGHGSSTCAPIRTYAIDRLADDLAAVITALDVQPPLTLVAHSMGGMAALTYLCRPAAQRPIDPSGLVLVATAARKLSQRGFGRLLSTPATAALANVVAHTPEHVLHGLVAPLCVTLAPIRGHLPAATIAATALTALTTIATSTAIGYLPTPRSYDIYPALPAIRARTVIISGGVDPLNPAPARARARGGHSQRAAPARANRRPHAAPASSQRRQPRYRTSSRADAETEERQRISH
jgi:pimeloyl-ACP methyl ester carboxylesterase